MYKKLTCFKAYDIRGKLGEELNEDIAYRIGRAYGEYLKPKDVVVGGDVRLTSESIKLALADGLQDSGVNVLDIGLSGTEEIYFATSHLKVGGGIEVTASHNPIDYNGMKLVREASKPISGDTGLREIQSIAENAEFAEVAKSQRGKYTKVSILEAYVDNILDYISFSNFNKPLKLVVNSGNGAAGHVIDAIESKFKLANVPVEFIKVHHSADGNFPNGIPNPLLPECRKDTSDAVVKNKADMGIAFDGDFDRCFLFDENGSFIEGYYIVGLLAKAFLDITLYLIGKITFVRVSKNIISILGRKIPHKIIITFRTLYTKHIVQCINDIRHIHCKYLFDIQNVVNKLDMYIIIKSLAEKALFKLRFKPQHIPSYRRAFTASVSRV